MPEGLSSLVVSKREQLKFDVTLERPRDIEEHPSFAVFGGLLLGVLDLVVEGGDAPVGVAHLRNDDFLGELLRNALSNIESIGLKTSTFNLLTILESNCNGLLRHFRHLGRLLLKKLHKASKSLLQEDGVLGEFPLHSQAFGALNGLTGGGTFGSRAFFARVVDRFRFSVFFFRH